MLVVVAVALAVAHGGAGAHHHALPAAGSPDPRGSALATSSNSAAMSVLGGQSLMKVVPFGPRAVWVQTQNQERVSGGGQGIEITTDDGRRWFNATPRGLGVDGGTHYLTGFVALSATRAWLTYGGVISSAHQILATTGDGGRHWSRVGTLPDAGCTLQFTSAESGTCVDAVGAGGSMPIGIYRTYDGGASWHKIFQSPISSSTAVGSIPFGCDKSVRFENATTGFVFFWCAGGTGATIYATSDGGVTWSSRDVAPPSPVPTGGGGFGGTAVFDGRTGAVPYLGGNYSAVFVTSDGGRTFHPVYPTGARRTWAVDLISPTRWRLTHGQEILATNNAGASWFALTSSTELTPTSYAKGAPPGGLVDFVTVRDAWLTENQYGSNSSLWHSTDGGRTWRRVAVPGTRKG